MIIKSSVHIQFITAHKATSLTAQQAAAVQHSYSDVVIGLYMFVKFHYLWKCVKWRAVEWELSDRHHLGVANSLSCFTVKGVVVVILFLMSVLPDIKARNDDNDEKYDDSA